MVQQAIQLESLMAGCLARGLVESVWRGGNSTDAIGEAIALCLVPLTQAIRTRCLFEATATGRCRRRAASRGGDATITVQDFLQPDGHDKDERAASFRNGGVPTPNYR